MGKYRFMYAIIVSLIAWVPCQVGLAQFADDAKWLPAGANCVVLISGERVFDSEIAKRENWADQSAGAFERGTSVIPPKVDRMVIGSQFDLAYMQPIWSVVLLSPSDANLDMDKLAASRNRKVDMVAEHKAMVLPNDLYLVQLAANNFGVMAPADRQRVTRWVDSGAGGQGAASPYIAEALSFADRNSDVTIAFDLYGAIDVDSARSRIKNFDSIKASKVEDAAKAISRLRGFMLGITIKDKIYAALRVDFSAGTSGLETLNKDAIIEALENNGVMIDDIRDWEFSNQSGTLMLNGTLSDAGLRQINSLVAQPVQAIFRGIGSQSMDPSNSQSNNPEVATKRYLDRIELSFKDFDEFLRKQSKRVAKPYARWFSTGAEQIDMLPADNVDPAALDFGGRVSEGFRDIAQILYAAVDSTESQNAELVANSTPGGYGYYGYDGYGYGYGYRKPSIAKQKEAIKRQNYADASKQAAEIMKQLRNDLGNVRRSIASGN